MANGEFQTSKSSKLNRVAGAYRLNRVQACFYKYLNRKWWKIFGALTGSRQQIDNLPEVWQWRLFSSSFGLSFCDFTSVRLHLTEREKLEKWVTAHPGQSFTSSTYYALGKNADFPKSLRQQMLWAQATVFKRNTVQQDRALPTMIQRFYFLKHFSEIYPKLSPRKWIPPFYLVENK